MSTGGRYPRRARRTLRRTEFTCESLNPFHRWECSPASVEMQPDLQLSLFEPSLVSMHYDITLTWTSHRPYLDFYPSTPSRSPVCRYDQIRREFLKDHDNVLPVPDPGEWTCPVLIDEQLYIIVTFFSEFLIRRSARRSEVRV